MRRIIGKGYEGTFEPRAVVQPQTIVPRPVEGIRVGTIPRWSVAYGRDLTRYESIFGYCQGQGNAVHTDAAGQHYVVLTPDQEERYQLPRDPSRSMVLAHENSRNMILNDNLDEPVWSWTVQANRDVIAWMPWVQDEPAAIEFIGRDVITASPRPVRNATLTQAGDRRYFQPLFGLLYVGHRYR